MVAIRNLGNRQYLQVNSIYIPLDTIECINLDVKDRSTKSKAEIHTAGPSVIFYDDTVDDLREFFQGLH